MPRSRHAMQRPINSNGGGSQFIYYKMYKYLICVFKNIAGILQSIITFPGPILARVQISMLREQNSFLDVFVLLRRRKPHQVWVLGLLQGLRNCAIKAHKTVGALDGPRVVRSAQKADPISIGLQVQELFRIRHHAAAPNIGTDVKARHFDLIGSK